MLEILLFILCSSIVGTIFGAFWGIIMIIFRIIANFWYVILPILIIIFLWYIFTPAAKLLLIVTIIAIALIRVSLNKN